jgi:2'-5' RNA ligase
VTHIPGPTLDQLDALGDDYAELVAETLATVSHAIVPDGSSVEDLPMLRTHWAEQVDETLLPALGVGFEVGAATIRVALREATGLTAAAWTDVPPTADALAEQYLAQARNRLVGVGDELWQHAREELLEGLRAGEGIPELAARVRKVAPEMTEPRAVQIARTEVVGACNAGALEQVRATGATGTKTWEAAHDARVRPEHEVADEQTVPLGEHFTVGGFPADRPHDPSLPPHLAVGCRCALGFQLDLASVQREPSPEPVVDVPVPPVGLVNDRVDRGLLAKVFREGLAALVGWWRARTASAETGGDDGPGRSTAPLQLPSAPERREGERSRPSARGATRGSVPIQPDAPRGPGEVAGGDQAGGVDVLGKRRPGPLPRRGLAAAAGEENTGAMVALVPSEADLARLPLAGVAGAEVREELHLTLAFLGEAADWTPTDKGRLLQELADLPSIAVVGEGFGANFWNPGSDSPSWNLAVGGVELEVVHGAVWEVLRNAQADMAAPEIPEQHAPWQPHICLAYTDDVTLAEAVAERVGPVTFDRLRVAFGEDVTDLPLGGVMIEQTIEPRGDEMAPEHFRSRMITEGLSTGLRTFAPGSLTFRDPPFALRWQEREPETGGHANAVHVGNVARAERQGQELWAYGPLDLDSQEGLEFARKLAGGFARWVSIGLDEQPVDVEIILPDEVDMPMDSLVPIRPKQEIYHSGRIAELTAVTVPAQAEAFIEPTEALLSELRARGVLEPAAAVAAAAVLDERRPPASWFADPELREPTGIVVDDEGRVLGHAATWQSCHIGFGDQCVTPPHEADHPYFLTGEVVTADGGRVAVGQVTLGTGHAPLNLGATRAAEHYDDTGSVVADVACGNDEHGIWVAGAVRPGVEPSRVAELRASGQLSGDWRRIGGQLRLVALLAVNVPGFPVPRPRARVASGDTQALVAAGKVAHDAGQAGPDLSGVRERIAASIGRDRGARRELAAARVRRG